MTRLTQTHVDHSTIEAIGMESVEFVTGRASEYTLSKLDISDSPEITHRRVAQDVQERGFSERVEQ